MPSSTHLRRSSMCPPTGKGVEIFQLPGGGLWKMLGVGLQADFPPQREQAQGKVFVPVFSQGDGTHIGVLLQAPVDFCGDL